VFENRKTFSMPQFTDMLHRQITVSEAPQRIVSLVPSQTELLWDLGLEERVIGITKFCVHPESWFRGKTRIGGTKNVHFDSVAALKPDLIIANKEENDAAQVLALESIAPVWVSDIKTLPEATEMIRQVGHLTGTTEKALVLAQTIETAFRNLKGGTRRRTVYGIWRNPWMWAGEDTFITDLMARAGWENALAGRLRYPEITLEEIAKLHPEVVLLSSEPYPFKEVHISEVQRMLPQAEVQLVDGEMFSWYGSRLLQAASYLETLQHGS
jgi:ABC-type Fe3+-hydroxamate transport system substrate-binding protein